MISGYLGGLRHPLVPLGPLWGHPGKKEQGNAAHHQALKTALFIDFQCFSLGLSSAQLALIGL